MPEYPREPRELHCNPPIRFLILKLQGVWIPPPVPIGHPPVPFRLVFLINSSTVAAGIHSKIQVPFPFPWMFVHLRPAIPAPYVARKHKSPPSLKIELGLRARRVDQPGSSGNECRVTAPGSKTVHFFSPRILGTRPQHPCKTPERGGRVSGSMRL